MFVGTLIRVKIPGAPSRPALRPAIVTALVVRRIARAREEYFEDAILLRRRVRRSPFPRYRLSHLEALEFRMLQIERSGCVIAGARVGGAERI
jgi:hypothetical protein